MFDPGPKLPKSDHATLSEHPHMGRRSSGNNGLDSCHAMIFDPRVQKTSQNYANYRLFNTTTTMEDESEISTPPLWSPPHPQSINYRCLSPTSKTQAIARGQRELMEMVSRMPESCYELSLKDLVEHQHQQQGVVTVEPKQGSLVNEEDGCKNRKKQNRQKPRIKRSGSIDNGGFLLKMVFPISLRSNKKNKNKKSDSNTNSKISPKPSVSDADKDWWKKRSGSTESESGGSTMNSGSTKSSRSSSTSSSSSRSMSMNNNSQRHESNGCLAFIRGRKSTGSR